MRSPAQGGAVYSRWVAARKGAADGAPVRAAGRWAAAGVFASFIILADIVTIGAAVSLWRPPGPRSPASHPPGCPDACVFGVMSC